MKSTGENMFAKDAENSANKEDNFRRNYVALETRKLVGKIKND